MGHRTSVVRTHDSPHLPRKPGNWAEILSRPGGTSFRPTHPAYGQKAASPS